LPLPLPVKTSTSPFLEEEVGGLLVISPVSNLLSSLNAPLL
jgi:hypothetical protein